MSIENNGNLRPSGRRRGRPNGWRTICLTVGALLALEAAVQLRAFVRDQDAFLERLTRPDTYVVDWRTGLRTFRPNTVVIDDRQTIVTNRLGLRSDDLPPDPAADELRVAVLGASSVAGHFMPSNEVLFPQLLERALRERLPHRRVNVINAGVHGYRLQDMHRLLEHRVASLHPDLVLLYAGFNDVWRFCGAGRVQRSPPPALPRPRFSDELLLAEILSKNAEPLRAAALDRVTDKYVPTGPLAKRPLERYRVRVEQIADLAAEAGTELVIVAGLKSYRRHMPRSLQEHLVPEFRQADSCFDLERLHDATEALTAVQRQVARERGLRFWDLAAELPGGRAYFIDGHHFNIEGSRRIAELLARKIATPKV